MKYKLKNFFFMILMIAQITHVYALKEPNESSSSNFSQSPNLIQNSNKNKDFKTESKKEPSNSFSSEKDNLLPPKDKVDDSEELDCNDLKLSIESSSPDDFGFIKNTKQDFENDVEWMKVLGIVFIILACAGFTYVLFGLLALRNFYKSKK